ncbi:MAG: PrsW family glutamic-type intramembrane protease [Candidatus Bathyarchaeia archaeon]
MGQPYYPPPPPPPPAPTPPRGALPPGEFHLPRTNLFRTIRSQLAALERPPQFKSEFEPIIGFLIPLVFSGFFGILIALGINNAILPALGQAGWLLLVVIAPIIEEITKALCMLFVVYAIAGMFPNRRYGAFVGAAAGLGFGTMESIIYTVTGQAQGIAAFVRLIVTPIMHPLWSTFVGIGVFVFAAKKSAGKSFSNALFGLPLAFLVFGIINHALWNAVAVLLPFAGGIWLTPFLSTVIDIVTIFPIFAFLLRDFLGGHFNFQHFFEALPEPSPFYPTVAPPPPPPQTFPTCPTCGQPLAYIQEYNRWYCPREKKYV